MTMGKNTMKTISDVNYLKLIFYQIWRNSTEKKGIVLYFPIYLAIWIGLIFFHSKMSNSFLATLIMIVANYLLLIKISTAIIGTEAAHIGTLQTIPYNLKKFFLAKIVFLQLISGISILVGVILLITFKSEIYLLCAVASVYFMGTLIYPLLLLSLVYYQPIKHDEPITINPAILYILPVILLLFFALNIVLDLSIEEGLWVYGVIAVTGLLGALFQPLWIMGLIRVYKRYKFDLYIKSTNCK